MRVPLFALLLSMFFFAGCGGPNRLYQNVQADPPKFDFVVIETPYEEIRGKTIEALSPYFTVTTRAEARVSGNQDKTMVVEVNGSRGIFGSTASIMLRRFNSVDRDNGRLVYITQKAGFFWSGFERAFVMALRQLDDEAACMSVKVNSKRQ